MTTAANAILLQYTAPVWVALFSVWFLSERVTWLDWISVAVVLAGMGLFFHEGLASTSLAGDVLAVLSGVTMAWMTLFMRKQKAASPLESILLGNVLAALVGVPFAFGQPSPELRGWIGLLLLGLVQIGVSYILYARAIKYVTAMETVLSPHRADPQAHLGALFDG
jgi:drug/metabolite transporter (DMT)-like permease